MALETYGAAYDRFLTPPEMRGCGDCEDAGCPHPGKELPPMTRRARVCPIECACHVTFGERLADEAERRADQEREDGACDE